MKPIDADKVKYEGPKLKLYHCDPAKHTKCERNECYKKGGMRRLTRYPEYAKTDKNGKPINYNPRCPNCGARMDGGKNES